MKKNLIIALSFVLFSAGSLFAEGECVEEFTQEDVIAWRRELNYQPKNFHLQEFSYLLNSLPEKVYKQLYIDAYANCLDDKILRNMFEFWDGKISHEKLQRNYQAYYVFYRLDRMAPPNRINQSK